MKQTNSYDGYTIGDKVWIYEFGDPGQCIPATVVEVMEHGFYKLDMTRYHVNGKLQKRTDIGHEDRMWHTVEEAIEATTQEFKEELQEATSYAAQEQEEWKALASAEDPHNG